MRRGWPERWLTWAAWGFGFFLGLWLLRGCLDLVHGG